MTTLSLSPTHPTPGKPVRVTLTLTESGTNFVRIWITDAPIGSEHRRKLDEGSTTRIEVFAGAASDVWSFEGDRAGSYVFTAQEYTKGGLGFGGGYAGDRRADGRAPQQETKVGAESLFSISLMQRLTMRLGAGENTATLALHVRGTTITATTIEAQGELTPAIVNPSSARARTAAVSTDVVTALNALAETTGSDALGDLKTILNEMIDDFNAHRTQSGVHSANDTNNVVLAGFKNASTDAALIRSAAELVQKLDRHMRNDNAGAGTGTAAYHSAADHTNTLVTGPPGSRAQVIAALADVWRAYEAHRVQTGVHSSNDTTNTLAALPKLLNLHRRFLEVVAAGTPSATAVDNAGAVTLMAGAGMEASNV